jgi:hypothetical protein
VGALALIASPAAATVVWQSTFDGTGVLPGTFVIVPTADGWTADSGAGIELQNNVAGAPSTGLPTDIFVELDSNNNSSMVRSVTLAGDYLLSFIYSPRPGIPATQQRHQRLPGRRAAGAARRHHRRRRGEHQLEPFSVGIHANAGSVIRFAATGTSDSLGGYLDNITLETAGPRTTVPNPPPGR